jgi:hypothetical protein
MAASPAAVGEADEFQAVPLLALTAGRFNMKHPDEGPTGGGVEYRWAPLTRWKLIPSVGFTLAEEGAAYGYAALRYDFPLGRHVYLSPVVGAGAFRNGGNLDLGYGLEFKTGLDISVLVAGRYRVGLLGYHLSNCRLSEDNPGTEVLEVVFALPLGDR